MYTCMYVCMYMCVCVCTVEPQLSVINGTRVLSDACVSETSGYVKHNSYLIINKCSTLYMYMNKRVALNCFCEATHEAVQLSHRIGPLTGMSGVLFWTNQRYTAWSILSSSAKCITFLPSYL